MRRRWARSSVGERMARSTPSSSTCPAAGSSSRSSARTSVDLPLPDSPTIGQRLPAPQREAHRSQRFDVLRSPLQPVRAPATAPTARAPRPAVRHRRAHGCPAAVPAAARQRAASHRSRSSVQAAVRASGRCSTIAPCCSTITRSAIRATTPRSCVTSRMDMSALAPSRRSRSSTRACVVTIQRRGRLVGQQQRPGPRAPPSPASPAGACRRRVRADTGAGCAPVPAVRRLQAPARARSGAAERARATMHLQHLDQLRADRQVRIAAQTADPGTAWRSGCHAGAAAAPRVGAGQFLAQRSAHCRQRRAPGMARPSKRQQQLRLAGAGFPDDRQRSRPRAIENDVLQYTGTPSARARDRSRSSSSGCASEAMAVPQRSRRCDCSSTPAASAPRPADQQQRPRAHLRGAIGQHHAQRGQRRLGAQPQIAQECLGE